LTQRGIQRQFGAETSGTRVRKRVGAAGWVPGMAERRIASGIKTRGSLTGSQVDGISAHTSRNAPPIRRMRGIAL
jgi:hypothetical protein